MSLGLIDIIPAPYRGLARLAFWGVLAFGLLGVGAYLGSRNEAARHARAIAVYANATAKAEADAHAAALRLRELEAASAATIAAIETHYLQEIKNADRERDALLSDLRAGRAALRLPVRACPPVLPAAGKPAAAGTGSDGAGDSDAGDARFVAAADVEWRLAEQIAIVARADATLTACQATVREYIRLTTEAAQARETGSREPVERTR